MRLALALLFVLATPVALTACGGRADDEWCVIECGDPGAPTSTSVHRIHCDKLRAPCDPCQSACEAAIPPAE